MGINWNRIIREQMRGVDPLTAFEKESKRVRERTRKEQEELLRKNAAMRRKGDIRE